MSNKIVFDASALIALFAKEPGYEIVRKYISNAIISSINIAEVYKYCVEKQNLTEEDCINLIKLSGIKVINFCQDQALITAQIVKTTKPYGLSLADRACIALAIKSNATILTCDRIWEQIDLGVKLILAR